MKPYRWIALSLFFIVLMSLAAAWLLTPLEAADAHLAGAGMPVYTDTLASEWQNGSWGADIDFSSPAPVYSGSAAIAVTINSASWGGLYLHTDMDLTASNYEAIHFWVHGGSAGGQAISVKVIDADNPNWDPYVPITPTANAWTPVTVTLAQVGSPATIGGLVWQDATGGAQPTFYVDEIVLIEHNGPPQPGPVLSVDVDAGRRAISPYIYGMNFADESLAAELALPVRRWGGNATTRYNWQNSTSNRGSDWYFENTPEVTGSVPLPDGSASDLFVEQDRRTNTKSLLTVPLIGWTPKRRLNGHPYDCGFKVTLYGPQESVDPWDTNCGNGVQPDGVTLITGNDPLDTSQAITPTFVQAWIAHLIGNYGTAANGGVQFYALDNEPMLWPYTHRDVHPAMTTYDEMYTRTVQYAAAIKAADPTAQTLGPVVWGWCAYFYSAADGCAPGADHQAHGNMDFVEWYLQQLYAYEQQHGVRLLDYVDVHIYPQANNIYSTDLGNSSVQALRLRSTRQLWDPTYVDESWIGQPIYLIPRMHAWVANNYPATQIAITEYNWGALGYMNGALAQADVLGIFGREGVELATLWGPPNPDQPGAFAFRMYRNTDGQGSAFGETSVQASSSDQSRLAIYAAQRSADHALTLVVINKSNATLTSSVTISNFTPAAAAQVYRYSAEQLDAIVTQPEQIVSAHGFSATFPAASITTYIVPGSTSAVAVRNVHTSGPGFTWVVALIGLGLAAWIIYRLCVAPKHTPLSSP